MKESEIRHKTIEILTKQGYVCWFPYKSKWAKESDVFGCYDILAARKKKVRYIQITTSPNINARINKILTFLEKNKVSIPSEVWGWEKKKKKFIIKYIV